ncbi:MAG: hypothetical protein FWD73_17130 [Polyangiaceae bacterium]|nr:hypothetical protein [Polyangiaceae bacterium]
MKPLRLYGLLITVGCLASCSTPFGEAPAPGGGSSSSDGGKSDGGSDQTNGGKSDSGSGQTSGDTDSGGEVVPLGPEHFSFVAADTQQVVQGKTTSVPITITRSGETASDIQITTTSVPPGVTVGPLTIPANSNTGQLSLTVADSVAQGNLDGLAIQGNAVGGQASDTENLPLFVRGKPGALDTTFAPGGTIENTTDYNHIREANPQSDGKILIGAYNTDASTSAVIRLNADGSVDTTFAGSDIQNIPGSLHDVAADANGHIVTPIGMRVYRYTANGALDTTFNNGAGFVETYATSSPIPSGWKTIYSYAVAVGQNGNIYYGGYASVPATGTNLPYAFIQIPTTGQGNLYGCPGSWTTNSLYQDMTRLSLLPSGALAFAGIATDSTGNSSVGIGIGRYLQPPTSCNLDPNYGTNGVWYSTDWQFVGDALFETDGSVDLLVGKASPNPDVLSPSTNPTAYSLVHIDPSGKQLTKADSPLVCYYCSYTESTGSGYVGVTRAPAPDNRYLIAGKYPPAGNASMAVVYYNSDLTPDTSMGNKGVITIPVSTALTSPTGVGVRAVYTPDKQQTIVVGSMHGRNAATNTIVEHFVVARIWN